MTAPKVILGVNGLVQEFGHFRGRLMHVFTYASMTAPFEGKAGRDRWALLPADPMGATVRKITGPDGSRIVIRTRFTYDPSVAGVGEAGRRDRRAAAALVRRALPRPRGPAASSYSWAGRLCLSLEPRPGLRRGGGGSLLRLLRERPRHGQEHARRHDGRRPRDRDPLRGSRQATCDQPKPSRLPPEPFARLGANAVIRWQEMRAGREG